MAFLDNSGDIILDAVLTDTGRKRMARGNFQITKFALGDDEIDYGLYDKNHPSGSAYYDLEILQTPILEAFTQANASVNYGLVTYTRNDLLYLPTIVLNDKNPGLSAKVALVHPTMNVFFLANDSKTDGSGNDTSTNLAADIGNSNNILNSDLEARMIVVETGIDSPELKSSSISQNTYLLGVGLSDSSFIVQHDNRFINGVYGPSAAGASISLGSAGAASLTGYPNSFTSNGASANGLNNYIENSVNGITSRLYPPSTGTDTTLTKSNIRGPRGSFTLLNFTVNSQIAQEDFSKFGSTGNALFGTSNTYDYIDTIVYVRGISTNIVLQIPIRVIQAAQT